MQVLATSASDAKKMTEILNMKDVNYETYSSLFKNLSDTDVKKCAEHGVNIFHGQVEPGMILYIPPGFTLGFASSGNLQSALKLSFLPSGVSAWATSQLSIIKTTFGLTAADTKLLDVVLDVLAVDQAQK